MSKCKHKGCECEALRKKVWCRIHAARLRTHGSDDCWSRYNPHSLVYLGRTLKHLEDIDLEEIEDIS